MVRSAWLALLTLPARRLFLANDQPVKLGSRAFDLLCALVQQRDRTVTKQELLDAVCPDQVVEEANLAVQVMALRKILGPGAIATLAGLGYRFAWPATERLDEQAVRMQARRLPTNLPERLEVLFGRARRGQRCGRPVHGPCLSCACRVATRPAHPPAVVDNCRKLDRIALALELAAARLPLLGLDGVRQRLEERFQVLTQNDRASLPRHRTLRAALNWSPRCARRARWPLRRNVMPVRWTTCSRSSGPMPDADARPGCRRAVLDPHRIGKFPQRPPGGVRGCAERGPRPSRAARHRAPLRSADLGHCRWRQARLVAALSPADLRAHLKRGAGISCEQAFMLAFGDKEPG